VVEFLTLIVMSAKFNEASESEVGKPLLEGIQAIQQSLKQLDEGSVVISSIG
jgi:hypothetical protein